MLDCQISMLNYMATMFFLSGDNPEPLGNSHFVHVPYNTYRTSDGFIIVAVIFDSFWDNLISLFDVEVLKDPKYKTQPGRLADKKLIDDTLSELFATNNTAHWVEQLSSVRVPCAPVNRFSEALSDPQVRHRKMVVDIPHPEGGSIEAPGNPIKLSADSEESFSAPPLLGEHTEAVLERVLGYGPERIAELMNQRIVG
jgi:crotonobetainyl-CoA:carnitine CoA-transferase CaiB-like acyl-CoA transferase